MDQQSWQRLTYMIISVVSSGCNTSLAWVKVIMKLCMQTCIQHIGVELSNIFSIVCANSSNLTIPISCKHLYHCYSLCLPLPVAYFSLRPLMTGYQRKQFGQGHTEFSYPQQGIKVFPLSTFLLKKIADTGLSHAARWFRKVSSKESTMLT